MQCAIVYNIFFGICLKQIAFMSLAVVNIVFPGWMFCFLYCFAIFVGSCLRVFFIFSFLVNSRLFFYFPIYLCIYLFIYWIRYLFIYSHLVYLLHYFNLREILCNSQHALMNGSSSWRSGCWTVCLHLFHVFPSINWKIELAGDVSFLVPFL